MNFDELASQISEVLDHPTAVAVLEWAQTNSAILFLIFAFAAGFVLGRHRSARVAPFQTPSEARVARILSDRFGPPDYHLMNHVTLPLKHGTTQVDHILVSRFGVFVIETKDYRGWIFADAGQEKWTQVLFRSKFRFQNPLRQNFLHVETVRALLDFLPRDAVKSVVLFTGAAEFKTSVPFGVFGPSQLIEYLQEQTTEVMSQNRMQFSVGRLETARLAISGKTDVEHVRYLQRRHAIAK